MPGKAILGDMTPVVEFTEEPLSGVSEEAAYREGWKST